MYYFVSCSQICGSKQIHLYGRAILDAVVTRYLTMSLDVVRVVVSLHVVWTVDVSFDVVRIVLTLSLSRSEFGSG